MQAVDPQAHKADLYKLFARGDFCVHDLPALIRLRGKGLLAEHILSGGDGLQDILLVVSIGGGHHDGVDLRAFDQVAGVLEALDAKLFRNLHPECAGGVGAGHNAAALEPGVDALNVGPANAAGTDQADFQFTHC